MAVYTYVKPTCHVGRLQREVIRAGLPTPDLLIHDEVANGDGYHLYVTYDAGLDGTQQTTLDDVVANHVGTQPAPPSTEDRTFIGAHIGYQNASTITGGKAGGYCSVADEGGLGLISWSGVLTASLEVAGAGGLDAGAEAPGTWYAVHAIGDSTRLNNPALLLSVDGDSPTFPPGYDMHRRLGWVRNGADGNLLKFFSEGSAHERRYWYDEPRSKLMALAGASAASFTAVSLASFLPPTSRVAMLGVEYKAVVGQGKDLVGLRRKGSSGTNDAEQSPVAVHPGRQLITMAVDDNREIEFKVDFDVTTVDLHVAGFTDSVE